jgi:hypothetical protein
MGKRFCHHGQKTTMAVVSGFYLQFYCCASREAAFITANLL